MCGFAALACTGADSFFGGDTSGPDGVPEGPSTECSDYCDAAMANCEELYATQDDCLTVCSLWDFNGAPGATEGNTVQCRTTYASAGDCDAAGPASTSCGTTEGPPDSGRDSGMMSP